MKKITRIKEFLLPVMIVLSVGGCKGKNSADTEDVKIDIRKILQYSALAGSKHNSQPWKADFFTNNSLLVFPGTSRIPEITDPKGIELLIPVGVFIENQDNAANAWGCKTEITLFETEMRSQLPATGIKPITGINIRHFPECEFRYGVIS